LPPVTRLAFSLAHWSWCPSHLAVSIKSFIPMLSTRMKSIRVASLTGVVSSGDHTFVYEEFKSSDRPSSTASIATFSTAGHNVRSRYFYLKFGLSSSSSVTTPEIVLNLLFSFGSNANAIRNCSCRRYSPA
uniref:Secreted protein n=1 Tax=Haemonchus placei TaxID=6290 RepID=A0A0N4WMQ5_HAEPC